MTAQCLNMNPTEFRLTLLSWDQKGCSHFLWWCVVTPFSLKTAPFSLKHGVTHLFSVFFFGQPVFVEALTGTYISIYLILSSWVHIELWGADVPSWRRGNLTILPIAIRHRLEYINRVFIITQTLFFFHNYKNNINLIQ